MKERHDQQAGLPLQTAHWRRTFAGYAALFVALFCLSLGTAYAATAATEQEAAQAALQQNGGAGKVLGISTETDSNGQNVFAVKILSNGRVRIVRIVQSP